MSITRTTGLALVLLVASATAAAQTYVGASLGQSSTSFKSGDYALGLPNVAESQDKTDGAGKLFAGYAFNRTWAVEGGYADLGKPAVKYTGIGPLAGVSGQAEVRESAWFVAGKGTLALTDAFNVFGKLGVTWNKAKLNASSNNAAFNAAAGLPLSASKSSTDALVGLGVGYNLGKQTELRFEYEDFGKFGDQNQTGRTRATLWSLGLAYRF